MHKVQGAYFINCSEFPFGSRIHDTRVVGV